MRAVPGALAALCALAALVPLASPRAQDDRAVPLVPAGGDFLVPLHTMPDDPDGGPYGLWAAGPSYKASFHDGFAFYPYRGSDRPLVRVHWRTESVLCGGVELCDRAPDAVTTEWRHELRYGLVTEAYDVRRDGIEQSFVLRERPRGGDVVVTGRVTSGLRAAPLDERQQDLEFKDGQEPAVRYGRAVAFDAAGHRAPVMTRFDGERVRLRLDRAFLDDAVFPVTIDPLTSSSRISVLGLQSTVLRTAITSENQTRIPWIWWSNDQALVAFSRQFAVGDTDAYGMLTDENLAGAKLVFADLTTTWGTSDIDVCFVEAAVSFFYVFQRDFTGGNSQLRILVQAPGSALNVGTLGYTTAPSGQRRLRPRIGGSLGLFGGEAMVVCEQELLSGNPITAVVGLTVTPQATVANTIDLHQTLPLFLDADMPAIIPARVIDRSPYWIVVWRERITLGSGYRIVGSRIDHTGAGARDEAILASSSDELSQPQVAGAFLDPLLKVSGAPGMFLMATWVRGGANGRSYLEARRFDTMPGNGMQPVRTLASTSALGVPMAMTNSGLACDHISASHWVATYSIASAFGSTASAVQLGHTAGVLETVSLHAPGSDFPGQVGVQFFDVPGGRRFLLSYATRQVSAPVYGRRLLYASGAGTTTYGNSCVTWAPTSTTPYAGDGNLILRANAYLGPAFLWIGAQPLDLSLTPAGMVGCRLLVDPIVTLAMTRNLAWPTSILLSLPDRPVFRGDLFVQCFMPATGSQPSQTSRGLKISVR